MTYIEQLEACEISKDKVEKLSTSELLEEALEYPFAVDVAAFTDYKEGLEHLEYTSNIYCELFKRKDLKTALIDRYIICDYDKIEKMYLDIMISRLWNENELDNSEKRQLLSLQRRDNSVWGNYLFDALQGYTYSQLATQAVIAYVSATGFTPSTTIVNIDGTNFIKGTYGKYGKQVECYQYSSNDASWWQIMDRNDEFSTTHSNWTYVSSATNKYNCHSYCWINQSPLNEYYLYDPYNFMTSSTYFVSHIANDAINLNDYVVIYNDKNSNYHNIAHSVVAISGSSGYSTTSRMSTTRTRSKFGQYGVYEASLLDVYNFYRGTYYKNYTPR